MPFDENVFTAIGRMSVAWSELERQSFIALHLVANSGQAPPVNDPTRILIAGMKPEQQWQLTNVFLSQPPADDQDAKARFSEWVVGARKLKKRRNEVIHSSWGVNLDDEGPSAFAFDANGPATRREGLRWDVVPGQAAEVVELAERLEEHHQKLSVWTAEQFRRLWPPARDSAPHMTSPHPEVREIHIVSPE